MKLQKDLKNDDRRKDVSKINITRLRQRVISLFDLQFILILGRDRNDTQLTYGELVNMADLYQADYKALSEIWGQDNAVLRPLTFVLCQIKLFENQIENGDLDERELVATYAQKHKESTAILIAQVMKSLSELQFIYDAANQSVKNYQAVRGRNA